MIRVYDTNGIVREEPPDSLPSWTPDELADQVVLSEQFGDTGNALALRAEAERRGLNLHV